MNMAVYVFNRKHQLIVSGLMSVVAILLPRATSSTLYRTARVPLEIHSNQSAPPKSAFESLMSAPSLQDIEWKNLEVKKAIDLNSTSLGVQSWNPIAAIKLKKMTIAEMHISKEEIYSSKTEKTTLAEVNEFISSKPPQDHAWVENLTNTQKDRLEAAQTKHQVLDQNWTLPTWNEMAVEKVDEINKSLVGYKASNPRPSVVGGVYVAAYDNAGKLKTKENIGDGIGIMFDDQSPKSLKIKGALALAPGIALGDRAIELKQYLEGIPVKIGKINLEAGTFEIEVENKEGNITAEIFEKSGAIVGSGSYALSQNDQDNKIEILVTEKSQFAGNLVSFNKNPDRLISDKLNSSKGEMANILYASIGVRDSTDILGSFRYPKISDSSWGIVRAQSKKFRDSIFLLAAGEGKNLPMMPESLISALEDLTADNYKAESNFVLNQNENHGGIIWGQVLFDGKPLSGVSISIELNDEIQAIYLDGFIPNKTSISTYENGFFVFTDLMPGYYSLVAKRNGEYFGHLNLVVDDNTVAIGNIENKNKKSTSIIKVYDAFSGGQESAQIHLQSVKESRQVHGHGIVQMSLVQRLSLGQAQPDLAEFAPTRFQYNDADDYIHVPLVRLAWLDNLSQFARISQAPNSGVIIGFVPEDEFEAYLPHEDQYSVSNIVYFDHHGNPTPIGTAGGGFVMFNVPTGAQSVVVLSKKTEMLSTMVLPVDESTITTLKFRF